MSVPQPVDQPFAYWWRQLRGLSRPTVVDRLHWSEDVYGRLFRQGSHLSAHERWLLEGWLLAHGAVVIKCRVPLETALTNAAQAPTDKHHDPAQVRAVWGAYERIWSTSLPVYRYDYTAMGAIATLPDSLGDLPFAHVGVGSPTPRVVFVGDRHNGCDVTCRETPLVFNSRSGRYLSAALEEAGLTLPTYHVLNGWHFHSGQLELTRIPDAWVWAANRVRFVALGRAASRALSLMQGVDGWAEVPHPQWWSRFRCHDLRGYARLLREAAGA